MPRGKSSNLPKPGLNHDGKQQTCETEESELTKLMPELTPELTPAIEIIPKTTLQTMEDSLGKKFDMVLTEIKALRGDIKLMAARVTLAEERIGTNEDDIAAIKTANANMEGELAALARKVEDLENRSRRNNVRLVGLEEKKEGRDMCAFLATWIPEVLGADNFPAPMPIERAHRVGALRHDGPNQRSREIIIKFLNFTDKMQVMRAARKMNTLIYEGKKVMFFPDFSVDLRKQRRLFDPVKRQLAELRGRDLRFGLIYPAKLLVTFEGKRRIFDTPTEANVFVQRLKASEPQEEDPPT